MNTPAEASARAAARLYDALRYLRAYPNASKAQEGADRALAEFAAYDPMNPSPSLQAERKNT